ncbi:MAG: YCF48-related protein [Candidatus Thorarchaeota archaeon]|nr:YCF48-related protein [Candidatus Thorarchaeota archaeon]
MQAHTGTAGHPDSPLVWEHLNSGYDEAVFRDVGFLNYTHGWTTGFIEQNGPDILIVLHTENGGDTWTEQLEEYDQYVVDLEIVDDQTVWITGKEKLFFTNNSDSDWFISEPASVQASYSLVEFFNQTHGWTATMETLYKTTDGGLTWSAVPGWDFEDDLPRYIEFIDDSRVLAIGWFGIYYSEDLAEAWEQVHDYGGWSLVALDNGKSLAVADNELMYSEDYTTWINLPVPNRAPLPRHTPPYLSDIFFLDDTHGWIVGDQIPIMYTPDGGNTWYEQSVSEEVTGRLMSVDFTNQTHGWAVGSEGIILRTTQGNLLECRLWMGITDPVFLIIVSSIGVIVIVGLGYYRRRKT